MSISTCPIRFKFLLLYVAPLLLLSGCATEPGHSAADSASPAAPLTTASAPAALPGGKRALPASDSPPSIIIRGKSGPAILASVAQYRSKKGMKVVERDARRLVLSMPLADSTPPAEARMRFTVTPVPGGQRLSGQIFRVTQTPTGPASRDVTAKLRAQLEAELAFYASTNNKPGHAQ